METGLLKMAILKIWKKLKLSLFQNGMLVECLCKTECLSIWDLKNAKKYNGTNLSCFSKRWQSLHTPTCNFGPKNWAQVVSMVKFYCCAGTQCSTSRLCSPIWRPSGPLDSAGWPPTVRRLSSSSATCPGTSSSSRCSTSAQNSHRVQTQVIT